MTARPPDWHVAAAEAVSRPRGDPAQHNRPPHPAPMEAEAGGGRSESAFASRRPRWQRRPSDRRPTRLAWGGPGRRGGGGGSGGGGGAAATPSRPPARPHACGAPPPAANARITRVASAATHPRRRWLRPPPARARQPPCRPDRSQKQIMGGARRWGGRRGGGGARHGPRGVSPPTRNERRATVVPAPAGTPRVARRGGQRWRAAWRAGASTRPPRWAGARATAGHRRQRPFFRQHATPANRAGHPPPRARGAWRSSTPTAWHLVDDGRRGAAGWYVQHHGTLSTGAFGGGRASPPPWPRRQIGWGPRTVH